MDSKRYWRKRQLEREKHWYDLTTAKLNDEVRIYYQQSLEKIQRDIAALYARFGAENKLSPAEARRLIRGDEFTVWRMTLEEYVKAAKGDSAILKELNTLAMRSRISRFEALHARTLMELADLCEKLERLEDAFQYRAYIANYYGNLYDIHKQYGLSTPPVAVDKNQAEKVVRTAWSGANYSKRIWKNGAKLESAIKETMLTAIHRGASIQKLSTDLSRRMQVGYNDAERLIRTELNYVQTRAAADSIISAEMGYYQFIAVMDNRTTPMCQSLDGEIFPIIELSQGENAPPMHVRCRSTIAASEDDGKQGRKPVGQRAARDEEGKRIKIPADMTYRDWKAVYIDKTRTLEDWQKAKDAEYTVQTGQKTQTVQTTQTKKTVQAKKTTQTVKPQSSVGVRDYNSRLGVGLGKKHYGAVRKIVESRASTKAAQVWGKFESEIKVGSAKYSGGAHHNSGSIYLNIAGEAKGDGFTRPYATVFHEGGHAIDWLMKDKSTGQYFSANYKNGEFIKALHRDFDTLVNERVKALKAEFAEHKARNDVQWFIDNYFIYWDELKADGSLPRNFKFKKEFAYESIKSEILATKAYEYRDLSDIIEGITKGEIRCGYGHGKEFWENRTKDGVEYGLATEAFAEFMSATIAQTESLALLQKYLPNALKTFEEMLETLLK